MADELKQAADPAAATLDWDQLGIPKPARNIPTKQFVREAVRSVILPHLAPLIEAQVAQARGLRYMVVRSKDGKFTRVPDTITPDALDALLAEDGIIVEVWTKDPSTPAFTDLMNRAIDKPKEQEQEIVISNAEETLARLDAWKAKNRAALEEKPE